MCEEQIHQQICQHSVDSTREQADKQTSSAKQPIACYVTAAGPVQMPSETHCSCSMFICLPIMG